MKKILNLISDLFVPPKKPMPTQAEMFLIDELKNTAHSCYSNRDLELSNAGQKWLRNLNKLCEQILQNDPRMFLQWNVIKNSMFVSDVSYVSTELNFLMSLPNWRDRWEKAINESPAGCPLTTVVIVKAVRI